MVSSLDFLKAVAHRGQKIVVCIQDRAIQLEVDDRLRAIDGIYLALQVSGFHLACRDIRRNLDDLRDLSRGVEDRVVGGLNPYFPAVLAKTLKFPRLELSARQFLPESLIFKALPVSGFHKHLVMAARNFLKRIAHRVDEVLVGRQDRAVRCKFDHRL